MRLDLTLKRELAPLYHAIMRDETRPYFGQVLLVGSDDGTSAIATDGHRLCRVDGVDLKLAAGERRVLSADTVRAIRHAKARGPEFDVQTAAADSFPDVAGLLARQKHRACGKLQEPAMVADHLRELARLFPIGKLRAAPDAEGVPRLRLLCEKHELRIDVVANVDMLLCDDGAELGEFELGINLAYLADAIAAARCAVILSVHPDDPTREPLRIAGSWAWSLVMPVRL